MHHRPADDPPSARDAPCPSGDFPGLGRGARAVLAVLLAALAACCAVPAGAGAVTCGESSGGEAPARGVPVLQADEAVTDAVFRQRTGTRTLPLIFRVVGCDLPRGAPPPTLEVNPRRGADELPDAGAAVTLGRVVADGDTLDVVLRIDSARFEPGSYGASVVLRAPHLVPSRTSISVSRSEDNPAVPAMVGAVAALAGLSLFALRKVVRRAVRLVPFHVIVLVALAGVVVGGILGYVNYRNQEVWTLADNWVAAGTAGFGGVTGGVMAGLLGGLFKPDA